ncbi:MAG: TrkA family potassium uptake protein [Planctomycetota bacterium]
MRRISVVGLGSFGMALARELARLGAQVTAVDDDLAHVEAVKDDVHAAVRMDGRDREALSEQGIHRADVAVVCMGEDFEAAEICAVHLQELGCPKVVVRGTSEERVEILTALVPHVITPAIEAARTLAVRLLAPGLDWYESFPGEHDIAMTIVPEEHDGRTLAEVYGNASGAHPVMLRRGEGHGCELMTTPVTTTPLRAGDHVFWFGTEKQLRHLGGRS